MNVHVIVNNLLYAYFNCICQGSRVTDKCKFLHPEYAMFQKLAHANNRYFLPYFLEMIDELKRRGSEK